MSLQLQSTLQCNSKFCKTNNTGYILLHQEKTSFCHFSFNPAFTNSFKIATMDRRMQCGAACARGKSAAKVLYAEGSLSVFFSALPEHTTCVGICLLRVTLNCVHISPKTYARIIMFQNHIVLLHFPANL